MQQEYLASSRVLDTSSLEEARDAVTRVYLPHVLSGPDDSIGMRLNAVSDSRLTLGFLTYQAETELMMPPTEDCYHVNLTTAGATWAERGDGRRAETHAGKSGVVLSPDLRNTIRWSPDAEQLILKISRSVLESHLSSLIGEPVSDALDFDYSVDLENHRGRSLLRAVRFLASELDQPDGLSQSPTAREQLESYVLSALLIAGQHQYSDALEHESSRRNAGSLAPVLTYIDEHLADPLTPELLARIGHMSLRCLQGLFRNKCDTSPMTYVRNARLVKARAELLDAAETGVSISEVARHWGFGHLSRFADQYRRAFGELPSETRRR